MRRRCLRIEAELRKRCPKEDCESIDHQLPSKLSKVARTEAWRGREGRAVLLTAPSWRRVVVLLLGCSYATHPRKCPRHIFVSIPGQGTQQDSSMLRLPPSKYSNHRIRSQEVCLHLGQKFSTKRRGHANPRTWSVRKSGFLSTLAP
ncbi:uncharacterized protein SCHCODRAFT_02098475 [Schizophyllum commune H4-8]|uniref:uncharacterized protein n=1 Tax=Schizophyllum commune (strain H4-8 / FGSC 9210) TaxID=578458 RepID=UPI00215DD576|nr:uncharacterized protein SCHCODRAFT_02098475 [Schizophyllum commune H4-8]KAI5886431.1 hypothetical protein SCHCODRAFT_02098475 [Schizophyllum commune H4-8]